MAELLIVISMCRSCHVLAWLQNKTQRGYLVFSRCIYACVCTSSADNCGVYNLMLSRKKTDLIYILYSFWTLENVLGKVTEVCSHDSGFFFIRRCCACAYFWHNWLKLPLKAANTILSHQRSEITLNNLLLAHAL